MLATKLRFIFNECWTIQSFINHILEGITSEEHDDLSATLVMAALINAGHSVNDASCCMAKWPVCSRLRARFFGVGDTIFWGETKDLSEELSVCRELARDGVHTCFLVDPKSVASLRSTIENEELQNATVCDPATFIATLIEFKTVFCSSNHRELVQQLFQTSNHLSECKITIHVE
jgi:hypothetical protein